MSGNSKSHSTVSGGMDEGEGPEKAIGGFFTLNMAPKDQGASPGCSVLEKWGVTNTNAAMFYNARSALRFVFNTHKPARIWAPAFICADAITAAPPKTPLHYFPIQPDLSPDANWLAARVRAGDCVLGVDYFGRAPASDFVELTKTRPDVLWVEDRAQALSPSEPPWGDWVVYSPRKLFGVPDGGVAVRVNAKDGAVFPDPQYASRGGRPAEDMIAEDTGAKNTPPEDAPIMGTPTRTSTQARVDREASYQRFRESEAAMVVSAARMSRQTYHALSSLYPAAAIARRRDNYAVLADALGDFALFADAAPAFAPLGFPVRHEDCDRVLAHLHKQRIFAARHWRDLPSPAAAFPWEHALAAEIMTLPCDQRYDAQDMQRVAQVFREAVG